MDAKHISPRCPHCDRVRTVPFEKVLTVVRRVRCKCGSRWVLVVTPIKVTEDRAYHKCEWNPVAAEVVW